MRQSRAKPYFFKEGVQTNRTEMDTARSAQGVKQCFPATLRDSRKVKNEKQMRNLRKRNESNIPMLGVYDVL